MLDFVAAGGGPARSMTDGTESHGTQELLVRVWGMNADGRPFFQNAMARALTGEGALLIGIEHALKTEEVIGVQYGDKKSRVRVVGVADGNLPQRFQVDVRIVGGQMCPWEEHVSHGETVPVPAASGSNKRQFPRIKVRFPLEMRDERGGTATMLTNSADISGRGCYVESMIPLPLGTRLSVTFWIESDKITTEGIIRSSDPGVGMGIEFIGLNEATKERLQKHLEASAEESAGSASPAQ